MFYMYFTKKGKNINAGPNPPNAGDTCPKKHECRGSEGRRKALYVVKEYHNSVLASHTSGQPTEVLWLSFLFFRIPARNNPHHHNQATNPRSSIMNAVAARNAILEFEDLSKVDAQ